MVAVKYGRQLEVTPEPPFLEQELAHKERA